jgi:hypothetical protein
LLLKRKVIASEHQGNARPSASTPATHQQSNIGIGARSLFYWTSVPKPLHLPSLFREETQGKTKEKEEGLGFRIREKPHATTTAPRQHSYGG